MKTALVTFNADGTMTLEYGRHSKHFDRLSHLVTFCWENNIDVSETRTIE